MTPRQAETAATIFTAAVIASVGVVLAGLTWRLADAPSATAPPIAQATVPRADVDIAPIIAAAPFGNGATGAPVPTTLPLELKGVLLAVPREASTALVAPAGGTPIAYRIGQPVPGGATIETIGIDNVILATGGHREILAFPKPGAPAAGGAVVPQAAGAPPIAGPAPAFANGQAPIGAPPPAPPGSGALVASPQSLLQSFDASAINGGYRVGPGLSPAVRQSGLQPGDVVEQINGTKLGNPATDQQLIAAAVRSGGVRIDVMRGDRRMTLSFPVR